MQGRVGTGKGNKPYGYTVESGYVGWVETLGRFILFATEGDYLDYIKEDSEDE